MQKDNRNGVLFYLLAAAVVLSTGLNLYLFQQKNNIELQYQSEGGFIPVNQAVYTETEVLRVKTMLTECQAEQERKDSLIQRLQSLPYRKAKFK